MRSLPLNDYSRWADFDHETAADWANGQIGCNAAEYMVEPILGGTFFQEPEEVSRALFALLSAHHFRRTSMLTLEGGIGRLAGALAEKLDVTLQAPVDSVRVEGDSVLVGTHEVGYAARYVVLATTASVARRLHKQADETERRLLSTPYSSSVNIALMTRPDYQIPPSLRGLYGVLIPRVERQHIVDITIESTKCRDRAAQGELFLLMLSGQSSAAMLGRTDSQILDAIKPETERFLPGVFDHLSNARIYRWLEALPFSPVGRAVALTLEQKSDDDRRFF